MRLVFGDDVAVAAWVASRTGYPTYPPYTTIGATMDDKIYCGGAVFNNYYGNSIDITLASDRAFTRGTLRGVFDYVFNQLKVSRLSAQTRRANKPMRHILVDHLNFQYEGVRKRYFGPTKADDCFLYALFRENMRKF